MQLGGRRTRRGGSGVLKCRGPRSADNDRRRFPVSDLLFVVSPNPPQIVDIGRLPRDLLSNVLVVVSFRQTRLCGTIELCSANYPDVLILLPTL